MRPLKSPRVERELRKLRTCRPLLFATALLLAALVPAVAQGETHTFLNTNDLYPKDLAGTFGPANQYPSSIVVSGLSGTVTKATVTLIDLNSSSPDDIDMVITGTNGQQVMLMSDACGENPSTLTNEDWTFDDSAPTYLSANGPCASNQQASFRPSNYLGNEPEPDDLSPGGGPAPPYVNALSFFDGAAPDGTWSLFVADDNAIGYLGFEIKAWALTLEVQPPATPSTAPPATPAAPLTTPRRTGKRAAALARCKKKKTKRARRRCRRKARRLPR
jgi:hypothetical protein